MSKVLIKDAFENEQVPFLRGILTRSLQDAGLPFHDSYRVASAIRQELAEEAGQLGPDSALEIDTEDLRKRVLRHLRELNTGEVAETYANARSRVSETILVRDPEEQTTPFSRGTLRGSLEIVGLSSTQSYGVVGRVYGELVASGRREIPSSVLGRLTCDVLDREVGEEATRRFLAWNRFLHSGRPLLVLIGGTAGSGKSTMATEVANRLEIVRTQSTDMLREVMRTMIPQRLLPVLHASSFNAWQELPVYGDHDVDPEVLLADGYRAQSELLSVACEAVIQRAVKEQVSLVLEGVHVLPSLLGRIPEDSSAVVVPVMLAVLSAEQLRKQIRGRGSRVAERRAERYLKHFDAIWKLQSMLLSDADRWQIPIIPMGAKGKVIPLVLSTVVDALLPEFEASRDEVFG